MSTGEIGVTVIGLRMGKAHLDAYSQNPHCRIIGVCDPDPRRLEEVRTQYQAPMAVTDYRHLLDAPEIRVVSVASPDFFHAEQCVAALRSGKDVLCEKPMTTTVQEAQAVMQAVQETGKRFMVGQVCRYAPGFKLAKSMMERGEIGELYLVESEYAHNYVHARGVGDWRVDARREPFLGGGCHAVDLLRWVAGDAEEAFAYANHRCLMDWPVNDCTMALFKFRDGVIGKAMASIGCTRPYTMRSVFWGTQGTIICDNTSSQIQLCNRKTFAGNPEFASFPVDLASHNVGAEIAEFIDCLLGGKPITTDEVQGAKTVATALAAVRSAKEGRPIRISELFPV